MKNQSLTSPIAIICYLLLSVFYFSCGEAKTQINTKEFNKIDSTTCIQRGHLYYKMCNGHWVTPNCFEDMHMYKIIDLDSITYRLEQSQRAWYQRCERCKHKRLDYTPEIDTTILWEAEK